MHFSSGELFDLYGALFQKIKLQEVLVYRIIDVLSRNKRKLSYSLQIEIRKCDELGNSRTFKLPLSTLPVPAFSPGIELVLRS